MSSPLDTFGPATRRWFGAAFAEPTRVQAEGWPRIAQGDDTLLLAPTGSGKTLAAFLACLDRLSRLPSGAAPGWRVIYVSPLKALVYDVERNLRAPLAGIQLTAQREGLPFRPIAVDVRTGDTSQRERRRMAKEPGDVLITTPESLYLLLGSKARRHFHAVDTLIIDEIHALAPTKRGAHLALSVERLAALRALNPDRGGRFQRLGLSATVHPAAEVARFLSSAAAVSIVDTSEAPHIDLEVVVPLRDMSRPGLDAHERARSGALLPAAMAEAASPRERASVWPAIEARILDLVQRHRSTIVFVNSRGLAERLAQRLNEAVAGDGDGDGPDKPLVRAHHGSISHHQRAEIEQALKQGELRGIVATSSLELGIDMGAVDLVVQVESPDSVARGLQRVGRAGHGVGQLSKGKIFPKHRGDLLEAAVVAGRMLRGAIEPLSVPRNMLDVLAQQIVAMCAMDRWALVDLAALIRRAYPYRELSDEALASVLDMLSGRYPCTEFADLRARVHWDREADTLEGRRGARYISLVNGGTIPDRGLYGVHLGPDGPRVGELDEEMAYEARPGETFLLGATSWRIQEITRDRVVVEPAPGEPGKMPFWRGDGPGRPLEVGRAIGAFARTLDEQVPPDQADAWLAERYPLDRLARDNLLAYLAEQRAATGTLPTDRAITVERFRDELGDWRVCLLTHFGARVHAPWALALESILTRRAGFEVHALWSDDGIALRFADTDDVPGYDQLALEPEEVEDLVIERLASSALFASQFRGNAARALLLPRRSPRGRAPLWQQRLKAQNLLAVARRYPAFPIILETYRACLQDVFDLDALREILGAIRTRDVRVDEVETSKASPFSRSLVFHYVAAFLYEGDAPLAERKAQALTVDKSLLRELVGHDELRDLLDAAVIAEIEAELQHLPADRRARDAEGLQDLLRRLGALTRDELAARAAGAPDAWLADLLRDRRAVEIRVAGARRWVAAEDVALYRDALGCVPPSGLPKALLAPVDQPLEGLLVRYARTHGPFTSAEAARALDLHPEPVVAILERLAATGRLRDGAFRPGGSGREWCDPEILRRLRRRTLARLRETVEPVDAPVLARFLASWHGLEGPRGGAGRLLDVVTQLEGLPLPLSELERRILPARVPGYRPQMLDELGATGAIVWVGRGRLGARDGRVALYRRDHAPLLLDPPDAFAPPTDLHAELLAHLERRGACFVTELGLRAGSPPIGDLMDALWDLVWGGLVTNDTFGPLRALIAGKRAKKRPTRAMRAPRYPRLGRSRAASLASAGAAGGRWSSVADLGAGAAADTRRAHALTLMLLERWGLVSREAAHAEQVRGGFIPIYPVLRALEEQGAIRRGYFVEGFSGAQFAIAGAVDRLRALRDVAGPPQAGLLAATDPANPYGALLPWPDAASCDNPPRRVAGASVVLVDGALALFVSARNKRLTTFAAARDEAVARAALGALARVATATRGELLTIEQVDGAPARGGPWEALLAGAGFKPDYRGMTHGV